jgi:hydroxymethylglutaryl-CoA lyase
MNFPAKVKIVEVGPRDGLQNEADLIPTEVKIELINLLSDSGLSTIEVSSFVSPKWIPQLADAAEVFANIDKKATIHYPVLVPNITGYKRAIQAGAKEIAIFMTASETFAKKNTNATVAESLKRMEQVLAAAKQDHVPVRVYFSCVWGCPYEGNVAPEKTAELAKRLYELGCDEISLGDTIGTGSPLQTKSIIKIVNQFVPLEKLAVHFHDTYGMSLVNIYAALECGISIVDSSVGGLGGCPYAKGASGNVATEDVLYLLHNMGIETGVDLKKIMKASRFIAGYLHHPLSSKVRQAMLSKSI